jgi:hypothetical protein
MIKHMQRDRLGVFVGARAGARPLARSAALAEAGPVSHVPLGLFGGGTGVCTDQRGTMPTAPQTYQNVIGPPSAALHERSP